MTDIIKGLGKFLSRDLMYVIGGGTFLFSIVLASGLKFTPILELLDKPAFAIILAGIAYVIGYLNQEVISLTHIVTTSRPKPNRFLCWWYKRFTGFSFIDPPPFDYTTEWIRLLDAYREEQLAEFERIISLKHIGSAVGSNWFLSSLVLVTTFLIDRKELLAIIISPWLFLASLGLILTAWIKGMQQYSTMYNLIESIHKTTEHVDKPGQGNRPVSG